MCGLRNTNDGLCSFCNFVSFFNTIKAFSQSSSDVGLYYKQKTCICSRAAKPPFLLPKNCVKMRMIFFSCAGRHQLCYAYNCVTLMWHIDGEILHLFYSIFSRKKCGIHSCYQLWNNPFRNSNYLPISKKPLLRRWAAVFRINNASFPNRHFNSMHFMG